MKPKIIYRNQKFFTFLLGLFSGLLSGLAFTNEKLWWIIFFSLVPLCYTFFSKRKQTMAIWGYALGYYVVGISWLYALLPVLPQKTGIFFLFFASLLISVLLGALLWLALVPYRFIRCENSWDIFLLAILYTLAEWLQEKIAIISFPWFRLSIIVVPWKAWIQSASLLGGLFLTFLILLANGIIAYTIYQKHLSKKDLRIKLYGKYLAIILIIGNLIFGNLRLFSIENTKKEETVLLVQGNHAGIKKWNISTEEILREYIQLTIEGIQQKDSIKLVVWPETAIPILFDSYCAEVKLLQQICQEYQIEILTGALRQIQEKQYNAMFLITKDGLAKEVYTKQVLVPFGEYLPYDWVLEKILPKWTETLKKELVFYPGEEIECLPAQIGMAGGIICYESIFAVTAKNAVKKGAEYIALISNDSWFGDTAALRQHHAQAILRAVEQRRMILRVSNTGITSIISPYGIITDTLQPLTQGSLSGALERQSKRTIYYYMGDSIAVLGIIVWGIAIFRRKT